MHHVIVPPNWTQLLKNSGKLVTTEQYDLSKAWFEGLNDPSADTILETPTYSDPVSSLQDSISRSQAATASNKGDLNESTNSVAHEGDNSTNQHAIPMLDSIPVSEGDHSLGMPDCGLTVIWTSVVS